MGSLATGANAGVSYTGAALLIPLIMWLLSLAHINMPADVVTTLPAILGCVIHFCYLKALGPVPALPTALVPVTVPPVVMDPAAVAAAVALGHAPPAPLVPAPAPIIP